MRIHNSMLFVFSLYIVVVTNIIYVYEHYLSNYQKTEMTKQNTERATITNMFDSDQRISCYLYCLVANPIRLAEYSILMKIIIDIV